MQPIFAVIIPIGGGGHPDNTLPGIPGHPDNSLPGIPPGFWGGAPLPGYPSHPIAPGGPGGRPMPPIYLPPGINIPVFPTNPIAPGGPGGSPDNTLPGVPGSPDNSLPGNGFVLIFHPSYGWILVPADSIGTRPDNSLPSTGSGGKPTQPIAPTPTPKA